MKLFLDTKNRRFVKSAASNVALTTLVLKRRDQVPIELVYVENGVAITPAEGTEATVALKATFADSNFLALAAPGETILDLYTAPVEAAFSSSPASIAALLEVRWAATGEALRTATLQVELQNSVVLGDEGTPAVIPDGKATQAEAEAGTDNEKWMTPLRTAQAIEALAATDWDSISGKPAEFPPEPHTADRITDFADAVVAVSPPVDWSSLTGKPTEFPPESHTHPAEDITGLSAFIIASAPGLSITTTVHIATGATDTYSVDGLASSDPSHVLVQLNGVTQTPTTDYLIDFPNGLIIFDGVPPTGTQIALTALGLRTVQPPIDPALYRYSSDTDGLTNYYGRISNTDYTGTASAADPVWTIHRTIFSASGHVVSTGTATAVAWTDRATATYTATP